MKTGSIVASGLILILGISFLARATDGFQAFTSETARRVAITKAPRKVPELQFLSHYDEPVSFKKYQGKFVLIDFIYTRCPDVCHSLGFVFKNLRDKLKALGLDEEVKLLSISFDPEYDKSEQLALYLKRYGPIDSGSWKALRTIDTKDLPVLLESFGIDVIENEYGGYDHNAAIHLLDRQGRLIKIFDYSLSEQALDEVLKRVQT